MKPVKLTQFSTNEELLSTMINEGKNVEYWHKKHYGGKHKYDKWQDEQLAKVQELPAGSELLGEMVDYHSLTTGNRWKTFEVTSCYGVGNAYTRMFRFCYWDTYGSVGAFYNCVTADRKHHHLLVFPSHFFLRYADRMGILHRDAALVCEFFNRNHVFAIEMSQEPDENGRRQFIIGSKEGACYGIARTKIDTQDDLNNHDNVFEVRTFLKYEQLTNRQSKECKNVKELATTGRLYDDAPTIHSIGRALTDKDFAKEIMERTASLFDITLEQAEGLSQLTYAVKRTTDFVSKDIQNQLDSLCKGELSAEQQKSDYHLMNIIAKYIKQDSDFLNKATWLDNLHIVHEWKGDNYDWNKWFWHLCEIWQKESGTENIKAQLAPLKQRCIQGGFTYKSIEAFMQSIYEN